MFPLEAMIRTRPETRNNGLTLQVSDFKECLGLDSKVVKILLYYNSMAMSTLTVVGGTFC